MLDVAARLPAAGQHQQRMNQHLAPIMDRGPLPGVRHRRRQSRPQPQSVTKTPQNEQTPGARRRRDLIAAACHPHITSAATVHLGDAPFCGSDALCATRIIPHQRGFSADANTVNAETRERVQSAALGDLADDPVGSWRLWARRSGPRVLPSVALREVGCTTVGLTSAAPARDVTPLLDAPVASTEFGGCFVFCLVSGGAASEVFPLHRWLGLLGGAVLMVALSTGAGAMIR